jgi:hypothetical protein
MCVGTHDHAAPQADGAEIFAGGIAGLEQPVGLAFAFD